MPINLELIEKAKQAVLTEAAETRKLAGWNQGTWVSGDITNDDELCGTTCCFAGHLLLASGEYELGVQKVEDVDYDDNPITLKYPAFVKIDTGDVLDEASTPYVARSLAGLTDDSAHALFFNFASDPEEYVAAVDRVVAAQIDDETTSY